MNHLQTTLISQKDNRMKRLAKRFLSALFILVIFCLSLSWAATLTVNTKKDELDNIVANEFCSLREAVVSANENRDIGGCKASGSYGKDTVIFSVDGTFNLMRRNLLSLDQDTGNLNILDDLTIDGRGKTNTIIDGTGIQGFDVEGGVIAIGSAPFAGRTSVILKDLTVQNGVTKNRAGLDNGGGISTSFSNLTLENVRVRNNHTSDRAGGIKSNGNLTIINSEITGNSADYEGGGILISSGTGSIVNSLISDNHTKLSGGGILFFSEVEAYSITNSIISDNTAYTSGAGIQFGTSVHNTISATISNSTISNNRAGTVDSAGVGGGFLNASGSAILVRNSIIAGNQDQSNNPIHNDCSGSFSSPGFNLIGDATGCSGFNASTDRTGSSSTPLVPSLSSDMTPFGSSPAIDAGGECESTDFLGNARPIDGDGDLVAECDIGAIEKQEAEADLRISISDALDPVSFNGEVKYTVMASNSGFAIAQKVSLVITLPGTAFNTLEAKECSPKEADNTVSCELGTLNPGSSQSRTLSFQSTQEDSLSISARVSSTTRDPILSNNTTSETTAIGEAGADLALSIADTKDPVAPGEAFNYGFTVQNKGPNPAEDIVVQLDLPASVSVSSTPANCTNNRCTLSSLASGSSRTFSFGLTAPSSGDLLSTRAQLSSATVDPLSSNNSASENTTLRALQADAELLRFSFANSETLNASSIELGREIHFAYRVANNGSDAINDHDFTFTLPSRFSVENCFLPECSQTNGQVRLKRDDLFPLNSGNSRQSAFIVELVDNTAATTIAEESFTATINVFSPEDPNLANNTKTNTVTVFPFNVDLQAGIQAPSTVQVNQAFNYILFVENLDSEDSASNAVLETTLPTGVRFLEADSACSQSGQQVRCVFDNLPAGERRTATVRVQSDTVATVQSTVSVSSDILDLEGANNRATVSTSVTAEPVPPSADLSLLASSPKTVKIGESFGYQFTVINAGLDTAEDTELSISLDDALAFEAASEGCSVAGQLLSCALDDLASGASADILVGVKAPETVTSVTISAQVSSTLDDPNPEDNSASLETTVAETSADLLMQILSPERVTVAESFNYTLQALNLGSDDAENVVVTHTLPDGLSLLSAPSECSVSAKTLNCDLSILFVNVPFDLTVQVKAEREAEALLEVSISSDTPDPDSTNNTGQTTLSVQAEAVNPIDEAPVLSVEAGQLESRKLVKAGDSNVVVLPLTLTSFANESIAVSSLTLEASGTGNDVTDLTAINLVHDANANGQLDPAEKILVGTSFLQDDGSASLVLSDALELKETQSFLITVDVANNIVQFIAPLFALSLLGFSLTRRQKTLKMGLLILLVVSLISCGRQAGNAPPNIKEGLTYQLSLTAVEATGSDSGISATVSGLPLSGSVLSPVK